MGLIISKIYSLFLRNYRTLIRQYSYVILSYTLKESYFTVFVLVAEAWFKEAQKSLKW